MRAKIRKQLTGTELGQDIEAAVATLLDQKAAVCEVTWGLGDQGLVVQCAACNTTHQVTDRADVGRLGTRASAGGPPVG